MVMFVPAAEHMKMCIRPKSHWWSYGWMHRCMSLWMRAGMDGQVQGWMGVWMDRWMDDAWVHGCMDAWVQGCRSAWMDGYMKGWMQEWRDGWMESWMGRTNIEQQLMVFCHWGCNFQQHKISAFMKFTLHWYWEPWKLEIDHTCKAWAWTTQEQKNAWGKSCEEAASAQGTPSPKTIWTAGC